MGRLPPKNWWSYFLFLCLLMSSRSNAWRSLAAAWQNSYTTPTTRSVGNSARDGWTSHSLQQQRSRTVAGSIFSPYSTSSQVRKFGSTVQCWQQQKQQDDDQNTPIPSSFSSSSWEASEFAIHVTVLPEDAPTTAIDAVVKALRTHREKNQPPIPKDNANTQINKIYTAAELLELGSVWYLPAQDMGNPYKKPKRLTSEDADFLLEHDDYLRIHHNPRRFPAVDFYDWSLNGSPAEQNRQQQNSSLIKPSVVIHFDPVKGYLVLNKPSECIPVHATVDNSAENIAACLRLANPELDYVVTPHRLDQNTSGLITLATSKEFAGYYAQLLRHKTASKLPRKQDGRRRENDDDCLTNNDEEGNLDQSTIKDNSINGIHKVYRCLVCLIPPSPAEDHSSASTAWSVDQALRRLQIYAKEKTVIRHYLEPSVRAPKRFVATLPPNATTTINSGKHETGWAECLMIIRSVGDFCPLRGNAATDELVRALWNSSQEIMPPTCQAIVELEVELLTGRTHQIRGQLSAEGYPLVGDLPYGGADPTSVSEKNKDNTRLALQCSQLEFLDPDTKVTQKVKRGHVSEVIKMVPSSSRWNGYQLESAWWTPFTQQFFDSMKQTSL